MAGKPPRVTPTSLASDEITAAWGGSTASVTQAWQLLQGALGYWLPHGLNQGIANAKAANRKR